MDDILLVRTRRERCDQGADVPIMLCENVSSLVYAEIEKIELVKIRVATCI